MINTQAYRGTWLGFLIFFVLAGPRSLPPLTMSLREIARSRQRVAILLDFSKR